MNYLMQMTIVMCMIEMLVFHVSMMMQLSPEWNLLFLRTMVASYFYYIVFRRSAYSFDVSNLDFDTEIRLDQVWFVPMPIRAL